MKGLGTKMKNLNEEDIMLTKKEVCCKRMWKEIESFNNEILNTDGTLESTIWYEETTRTYHILSFKRPGDCEGWPIDYCPFCGAKLPTQLDPEDYILQEYGEDYLRYTSDPEYKAPPEEFKSDEWWKKRGL